MFLINLDQYTTIQYRIIIFTQWRQMRIQSPDLSWHGEKDRVLSIDFHPFTNQVVTAGSDQCKYAEQQREGTQGCIKVWQIVNQGGKNLSIKILYGLSEASDNTNVAKFSPNGAFLASGADDKCVVIWEKRQNTKTIHSSQKIIRWSKKIPLSGHAADVLDLAWTRDSKYVISVGMDRRIMIWQIQKKAYVHFLDFHQKFVQGVAVDPTFEHIISCSNDRTSRVWKAVKSRKQISFFAKRVLKRFNFNKKEDDQVQGNEDRGGFRIFADQSIPTFFRRPDFSPDGQLFLLPAGQWQRSNQSPPEYCAFLYRKNFLDKPTVMVPTNGEPALVCKFCPVLFKKPKSDSGIFKQSYYMVFAIATSSSVLVYDTLSMTPICGMGNYHYATITSLTWKGSNILGMSSSDGYCSFLIFEQGQLGQVFTPEGELAQIMKIEPMIQKKDQPPVQLASQQQRVEIRQVEGGGTKKTIKPKVIQTF